MIHFDRKKEKRSSLVKVKSYNYVFQVDMLKVNDAEDKEMARPLPQLNQ